MDGAGNIELQKGFPGFPNTISNLPLQLVGQEWAWATDPEHSPCLAPPAPTAQAETGEHTAHLPARRDHLSQVCPLHFDISQNTGSSTFSFSVWLGTHKLLALVGWSPAGSMSKTDPPLCHCKLPPVNTLGKCVRSSASSHIIQTCWLNTDEGSEHWISLYQTWIALVPYFFRGLNSKQREKYHWHEGGDSQGDHLSAPVHSHDNDDIRTSGLLQHNKRHIRNCF